MKASTASTVFGFTAAVSARPADLARRQAPSNCILPTGSINPNSTQLANAILKWADDIHVLNGFVNNAPTLQPEDLLTAATNVLPLAEDQLCQLAVLQSNSDGLQNALLPSFYCAVNDINNGVGNYRVRVLEPLSTIIANPTDPKSVQDAIRGLEVTLCCNTLFDADAIFFATATDSGITDRVPLTAERPNFCQFLLNGGSCVKGPCVSGT